MSTTVEPDHYANLGVSRSATTDEVRAAYRLRARLFHPDSHVGTPAAVQAEAERLFAALNEAHRVLTSSSLRAAYDSQTDGSDKPDIVDRFVEVYSQVLGAAVGRAGLPETVGVFLFEKALSSMTSPEKILPPGIASTDFQNALAYQITKTAFLSVETGGKKDRCELLGAAYWMVAGHFCNDLPATLIRGLDGIVTRPSLPRPAFQGPLVPRQSRGETRNGHERAENPHKPRSVLSIVGWCIAGLVALSALAGALGSDDDPTTVPVDDVNGLAVGDCLESLTNPIVVTACTGGPMDNVVYRLQDVSVTDYPGDARMQIAGDAICSAALTDDSQAYTFWVPSPESWTAGDRTVVCVRFST